jgi:hypothetical protein
MFSLAKNVILQRRILIWYTRNRKRNLEQTVHLTLRDHFEDSGIAGIIILKEILQKYDITTRTGLIRLRREKKE